MWPTTTPKSVKALIADRGLWHKVEVQENVRSSVDPDCIQMGTCSPCPPMGPCPASNLRKRPETENPVVGRFQILASCEMSSRKCKEKPSFLHPRAIILKWTPLSRPFFARNKLMPTGSGF